jgi:hypothetical protein
MKLEASAASTTRIKTAPEQAAGRRSCPLVIILFIGGILSSPIAIVVVRARARLIWTAGKKSSGGSRSHESLQSSND